jgi:hypothetical protein
MTRTPPFRVKYELRREVSFGCPVKGCGSPYLTYHHFDPPFHVEEHHDPARMIALCWTHHQLAEGGAFTVKALRMLKEAPFLAAKRVRWRFDVWDRRRLVLFAGGNWHVNTTHVLSVGGQVVVGLSLPVMSDPGGLNLDVRDGKGRPVLSMEDNAWTLDVIPDDLVCSPHGNTLRVSHEASGIELNMRFHSLDQRGLDLFLKNSAPLTVRKDLLGSISDGAFEWPLAVATLSGVLRWPFPVILSEYRTAGRRQLYEGNVLQGGITLY